MQPIGGDNHLLDLVEQHHRVRMPPAAIATVCQMRQSVWTVVAQHAEGSEVPFAFVYNDCCTKLLRDNAATAHQVQKQLLFLVKF